MYPTSSPARNMILGQLITSEVLNRRILEAMNSIRREDFLPDYLKHCAYVDEDLDLGNGRCLMEPVIFAKLLQLAQVTPECRVLCVGCLSGYPAAVLAKLASHIVGIDIDADMIEQAGAHMQRLRLTNVDIQKVKTLPIGYQLSAPYDVILVNGAIDFVPEDLGSQLALHGRLVAVHRVSPRFPGVKMGWGKGLLVKRIDNRLHYREYFDASTAPLPGFEREEHFHL